MKKSTKWFLIILLLVAFLIWAPIVKSPVNQSVRVIFMDVGQGDAILVEKGDYQILIDGGPDDSVLDQLGKYLPLLDRKIELAILTHPHADHLTGFNIVLERYEVERVVSSDLQYDSNTYQKFTAIKNSLIKQGKTDFIAPTSGQKMSLFDGAEIEFLWPPEQLDLQNINNTSIVSRFCYIEKCIFLPGDLEIDAMAELIDFAKNKNFTISSDLIKLPHHGSSNGTNQLLLDVIKPKFTVISVGAQNKFNHPHESVLKLIEINNLPLYKTSDSAQVFMIDAHGVVKVN